MSAPYPPPAYADKYAESNPPPAYATAPPSGQQPQGGYGPPPPPSGQQPPGGYVQTTHVQVVNTAPVHYGEHPVHTTCQFCQSSITTATEFGVGLLTWIVAGVICLFGLWLGCCLIPFCLAPCKDVNHVCPNCRKVVGVYKRIS